jgi:hypothetical protein
MFSKYSLKFQICLDFIKFRNLFRFQIYSSFEICLSFQICSISKKNSTFENYLHFLNMYILKIIQILNLFRSKKSSKIKKKLRRYLVFGKHLDFGKWENKM